MAQPSNGQTGNLQTGTANPTPHKSETRRKFVWCLIIISFICSLGVGGSVVFLEKQNIFPNTDGHGRMEYLVVSDIPLISKISMLIAYSRLHGLLYLIYFLLGLSFHTLHTM
jgi:hypothetical protein